MADGYTVPDEHAMLPPPDMEQHPQEFYWMMARVGRVKSLLEIGSREGGCLKMMVQFLDPGASISTIDIGLPNPEWQNGREIVPHLRDTIGELRGRGFDAQARIGDSADPASLAWARERGPFDLVFIDADHSYDAVKRDWENYRPLGAIIGFHDIAGYGVKRLWAEIKASGYVTEEMIVPDGGMGIGLVRS